MKLHLLKLTLAALAGVIITPTVHAGIYTGASEDLILSFQDSTSSNDLQIDLGSITQFTGAHVTFSLNIGTDLANIFGSGYYTDSGLKFSIAGTNNTPSTLNTYAANTSFVGDPTSTPFDPFSTNGAKPLKTQIGQLYNPTSPTAGSTPNSDVVAASSVNSYTNTNPSPGDFGNLSSTAETTFGLGSNPVLYLDILKPGGTSAFAQDASGNNYVFSIDSTGLLTYSAAAVPEPSTYAMLLLGAAGLLVLHRRKSVSNL